MVFLGPLFSQLKAFVMEKPSPSLGGDLVIRAREEEALRFLRTLQL